MIQSGGIDLDQILERLTDSYAVEPLVHQLFEWNEPEVVKAIIDQLNSMVSRKNEEMKKMLSQNHHHLFSCTDLIEQLKAFSSKAKSNQEKIDRLQKMEKKEISYHGQAKNISNFEISEESFKVEFINALITVDSVKIEDAIIAVVFIRKYPENNQLVASALIRTILIGLRRAFDEGNQISQDQILILDLLLNTHQDMEDCFFIINEVFQQSIEEIIGECDLGISSFFKCLVRVLSDRYSSNQFILLITLFNSMIATYTKRIIIDYEYCEEKAILLNWFSNIAFSVSTTQGMAISPSTFKIEEHPRDCDFVTNVASIYRDLISNNVVRLIFNTSLIEEYSENSIPIQRFEEAIFEQIEPNQRLRHVLKDSWEVYIQERIEEQKKMVNFHQELKECMQHKDETMFLSFIRDYTKKSRECLENISRIIETDTRNIRLLKLDSEDRSLLNNFSEELLGMLTSFNLYEDLEDFLMWISFLYSLHDSIGDTSIVSSISTHIAKTITSFWSKYSGTQLSLVLKISDDFCSKYSSLTPYIRSIFLKAQSPCHPLLKSISEYLEIVSGENDIKMQKMADFDPTRFPSLLPYILTYRGAEEQHGKGAPTLDGFVELPSVPFSTRALYLSHLK